MQTKLLSGIVQSGGDNKAKPLGKVPVIVFEATAQQPTIVGTATTRDDGRFDVEMELDKSDRIFYAVATVNQDIQLVTIIGSALQYDRPAWITASPPDVASHSAAEAVGLAKPPKRAVGLAKPPKIA